MAGEPKIDRVALADVMDRLKLSSAASGVVKTNVPPSVALEALTAAGFMDEGLRLVANCLPKREAVWWACMCAEMTAPAELADRDRAATRGAQDWVRRPGEETAWAAWALAEGSGMTTAEAWTAVAAFWSGSTLTAKPLPAVPPPPSLTGQAVYAAVALARARWPAEEHPVLMHDFLMSAREISVGGSGRPQPKPDETGIFRVAG